MYACMYVSRSHNATIVGVQVVNCFGPDSSCSSGEDLPRTAATCDHGDYGFTTHSALLLTTSIASVAAIISVTDISSCHHHHCHAWLSSLSTLTTHTNTFLCNRFLIFPPEIHSFTMTENSVFHRVRPKKYPSKFSGNSPRTTDNFHSSKTRSASS